MTPIIPTADAKESAIVALVNWRIPDRAAVADKSNPEKQREEYKLRKSLRAAADRLMEARNV